MSNISEVKRFNIAKGTEYQDKNTKETKKKWDRVGSLTTFVKSDGTESSIVEIPAIGLKASVFPFDPKREETAVAPATPAEEPGF